MVGQCSRALWPGAGQGGWEGWCAELPFALPRATQQLGGQSKTLNHFGVPILSLQPEHSLSPSCKPRMQGKYLNWVFKKIILFLEKKKEKAIFSLATRITNTQKLRALICVCISTVSSQQGFWTRERQIVLLPYKRGTGGKNAVQ